MVFQITRVGEVTLVLFPPQLEDSGEYVCVAVNEVATSMREFAISVMGELTAVCMCTCVSVCLYVHV